MLLQFIRRTAVTLCAISIFGPTLGGARSETIPGGKPGSWAGLCVRVDVKPKIGARLAEAVLMSHSDDAVWDKEIAADVVGMTRPAPYATTTHTFWMVFPVSRANPVDSAVAMPSAGPGANFNCDQLNLKLCGRVDCRQAGDDSDVSSRWK